jgi:hypothetical protein
MNSIDIQKLEDNSMLHIYTDEKLVDRTFINNVDSRFDLECFDAEVKFTDEESVKILQEMEGMTERHGGWIEAKFGIIPLTSISTGCKGLLLCLILGDEYIINIDELGYNAIKILYRVADNKEVYVVSHRALECIPENYKTTVNDEPNVGIDTTYALEYLLDEVI